MTWLYIECNLRTILECKLECSYIDNNIRSHFLTDDISSWMRNLNVYIYIIYGNNLFKL